MKLNRGSNTMRKGNRRKKDGSKQTQGFGKCGEICAGEGEEGYLRGGGEIFGDACGKNGPGSFQGNGKRGFWIEKKKRKKKKRDYKNRGKRRIKRSPPVVRTGLPSRNAVIWS